MLAAGLPLPQHPRRRGTRCGTFPGEFPSGEPPGSAVLWYLSQEERKSPGCALNVPDLTADPSETVMCGAAPLQGKQHPLVLH